MFKDDFYTKRKPPIQFNLRVIATDLPMNDPDFKIKIDMDFTPDFTPEQKPDRANFNANRVTELLRFVSDKVIRKVVEFIYYDRSNLDAIKNGSSKETELADNFHEALNIYDERLKIKSQRQDPNDNSYADHREVRTNAADKGFFIEEIVNNFINKEGRKVDLKEQNVIGVTYTVLSDPKMHINSSTPVNGDKKLPR